MKLRQRGNEKSWRFPFVGLTAPFTHGRFANSEKLGRLGWSADQRAPALGPNWRPIQVVSPADIYGSGQLVCQAAVMTGSGSSFSSGSGSLVAQSATMAGSGSSGSSGSGALVAQSAAMAGSGSSGSSGSGVLAAQSATMAGSGSSSSSGSGVLVAQEAAMTGSGASGSSGFGDLVAQIATILGQGSVFYDGLSMEAIEAIAAAIWNKEIPLGNAPDYVPGTKTLTAEELEAIAYYVLNKTLQ